MRKQLILLGAIGFITMLCISCSSASKMAKFDAEFERVKIGEKIYLLNKSDRTYVNDCIVSMHNQGVSLDSSTIAYAERQMIGRIGVDRQYLTEKGVSALECDFVVNSEGRTILARLAAIDTKVADMVFNNIEKQILSTRVMPDENASCLSVGNTTLMGRKRERGAGQRQRGGKGGRGGRGGRRN